MVMIRITRNAVLPGMLLLLSNLLFAQTSSLDALQGYADIGAVRLAIRIMDREQPALLQKPEAWMNWERQRIALYSSVLDWQAISERLDKLPEFVSREFIIWARVKRAEALIAAGDGAQARLVLRSLIWSGIDYDMTQLAQWRRLIIQSYLGDGLAVDARLAAQRFQQDFARLAEEDKLLRARIALLNEEYVDVIAMFGNDAESTAGSALFMLAQLRGEQQSAGKVLQHAHKLLNNAKLDKESSVNLWVVAAEAARAAGQIGSLANALEHVLAERNHISLPKAIVYPTSDDLWTAYLEYARQISNREHMLIGQDEKWLALAESIHNKQPVGARALTAFVMLHGANVELRKRAATRFVELMMSRKHGAQLLQTLFNESSQFSQRQAIPEPVRHKLVDLALAASNIDLASEIMATIEQPPAGADQFMWQLRRARILVLGSKPGQGARALQDILDTHRTMQQAQIDMLMQVIFDLQTADQHDSAIELFAKTLQLSKDDKLQREIYYWMAESRKAQERYDEAAQLYLQSAMHPDPKNMDPWAQTAHYQAAEALYRAGLLDDAQALFERLLRVTEDPTRRATLKNALQKLWAKQ